MRSNLNVVEPAGPAPASGDGFRPTVLVVSRERVGRVFVVHRLRDLGLGTVISDNAQQAVRRMNSGQGRIAGIVIVGDLADGTAESYGRWLRAHGHTDLPLIGVGTDVDADDPRAHSIDPREWWDGAADLLAQVGLFPSPAAAVAVAA